MKYIKLFENFKSLEDKLKGYGIKNYIINDDDTIDVDGDVDLSDWSLSELPFSFGKVSGHFLCNLNILKTLKGCPEDIGGDFRCDVNRLTSLEFGPKYVGGDYYCSSNKLTSLKFSPSEIPGTFSCASNNISILDGMPLEIGGDFRCRFNENLKELNSISNIEGYIICDEGINISKFTGYCKGFKNFINNELVDVKLNESNINVSLEDKLKEYGIKNYTINDDGTIDVNGDVQLSKKNLEKIPFKFGKVTGGFFVGACDIKTLEGCPYEIEGDFDCSSNRLGSFEFGGVALEIGESLNITRNQLNEIDIISNIEGDIYCDKEVDIDTFRGYCREIKPNLI